MGSLGKPPFFDGKDYDYWKTRMRVFLQSMGPGIWEIVENGNYVVRVIRITQHDMDEHEANSKAMNALFSAVSREEYDRICDLTTAREMWARLRDYHEGTTQVKTRLYETYRREYENFSQQPGESIDSMFSRFQAILNKVRTNKPATTPLYSDHDRAMKLLHGLDLKVWEVKVSAIVESAGYDTLTVDELFSKLKASEVDKLSRARVENPAQKSVAFLAGPADSACTNPNPTSGGFALASMVSVTEEQLETLGDHELALIITKFQRVYNNRKSRGRGGQVGCFECGSFDHFIAHCPKLNHDSHPKDENDYSKRDGGKYRKARARKVGHVAS
jgi:hypothetical protein